MSVNFFIYIWVIFILDRHTVIGNNYVFVNEGQHKQKGSEYLLLLVISRLDSFKIISTTVAAKCYILLTSSVSQ